MLIDIHIHTNFSFDSDEDMRNYLNKAKESAVPVIGFSEHYDYDAYLDGADITLADVDKYSKCVNELKLRDNCPDILFGIELGFSAAAAEKYCELTNKHAFDYIINSVHTVKGRGDSYYSSFFANGTTKEAYNDYFDAVLQSLRVPYDFQIVGHLGYVSRYRNSPDSKIKYADYSQKIDEILKEIILRDKCLEINTSSGKAGSEFLPDSDIILRYIELGGEKLSFGSDAHRASDYLRKSRTVYSFLKDIGVKKLYYYKNRRPIAYEI